MSVRIGEVPSVGHAIAMHVQASSAGVELTCDPTFTLTPTEARNFAALLVRSADEVERMRRTGVESIEYVERVEYITPLRQPITAGDHAVSIELVQVDPNKLHRAVCTCGLGSMGSFQESDAIDARERHLRDIESRA